MHFDIKMSWSSPIASFGCLIPCILRGTQVLDKRRPKNLNTWVTICSHDLKTHEIDKLILFGMGWSSVCLGFFPPCQGIDKRKCCICFPGGSLFLCTESFILSLQVWVNMGHQQVTVLELAFYISRNSFFLKLNWRPTLL